MINELININEQSIKNFNYNAFLKEKKYPVVAALSALKETNKIQKCYFSLEDQTEDYNVMKLYALLQSLFVSIDSLYALSYSLTGSKNYININKNQTLRNLKYIRNDVVGHPANRILNSEVLAYCILDSKSITKESFSYDIYSKSEIITKHVSLIELISAYYEETNVFLNELQNVINSKTINKSLEASAIEVLQSFKNNEDYASKLSILKEKYLSFHKNAKSNQHRVLWRIEIINDLLEFKSSDQDIKELQNYVIGLEIIKICQLLSNNQKYSLDSKLPKLVLNFYRFLNQNKELIHFIERIDDIKNPLFSNSIEQIYKYAKKKKAENVCKYIELLYLLFKENNDNLLYGFSLPIREYRKKS